VFNFWLTVVVSGGLLQIICGVLTLRHARKRWKSAGDGRTFLAYLLERPKGWITAKIKRARHWWRQRRRPVTGSVTIQTAAIQVEAVAVVAAVRSVTLLDGWPTPRKTPRDSLRLCVRS
jgi:hypothetical protein